MPSRTCSHCGNNGHNLRTCSESGGGGGNGIMLFGVRVMEEGSFRKSVSMGNLSQYQQSHDPTAEAAYASDDAVHASVRNRERRRGVPWTEEEHRLFLLGLQKVGKGDWRGISRSFVKTRTPTQVASHAQKYFLRRSNHNRRRRRSSLFDITTEMCMSSSIEEDKKVSSTALPFGIQSSVESLTLKQSDISVPVLPSDLSLNHQVSTVDTLPPPALSLMLRTPLLSDQTTVATVRPPSSAFPVPMSGGNFGGSGENIISVA